MSDRTFLDIDESILTKNLILPDNLPRDDILRPADSKPFFIIQPTPGICVKAKTEDGDKVFLNICTSDKIPPPEDISEAQLFEILSEEIPSFVIPMSIGSERLETDKGGTPCATYDIAINATYFQKCQKNKNFLLFTTSVIMDGVSNKFNKTLNSDNYTILKNRKVIGKLQQHRIENREPRNQTKPQKPLIGEIKSRSHQVESIPTQSKYDYVLLKQPKEGTPVHLIGLFQIPKGITSKEVGVRLDRDRIVINVKRDGLIHDLSLPHMINVTQVKCLLDKDLSVLRLNMPVEDALTNVET